MEIDTSNLNLPDYFSTEDKQRVEELVGLIQKEYSEKKTQKWWIMPKYSVFGIEVQEFGQSYFVEPQKETYSRNKPPLKSDFESKETAEKWLKDYLAEEDLFLKAIDEINNLNCNLGHLVDKLRNHHHITNTDIHDCFESFSESLNHGSLNKVTEK